MRGSATWMRPWPPWRGSRIPTYWTLEGWPSWSTDICRADGRPGAAVSTLGGEDSGASRRTDTGGPRGAARAVRLRGGRQRRLPASRGRCRPQEGDQAVARGAEGLPDDQDPPQRHDRDGSVRERGTGRPAPRDQRPRGEEGDHGPHGRRLGDAEELESPLQVQPGEDQDR